MGNEWFLNRYAILTLGGKYEDNFPYYCHTHMAKVREIDVKLELGQWQGHSLITFV